MDTPIDDHRAHRRGPRWIAAAGAASLLFLGACSDSDDPDPGEVGTETEIDGGEADTGGESDSTSSTADSNTTGGATGGGGDGTQGNQMTPGETTPETAQTNE